MTCLSLHSLAMDGSCVLLSASSSFSVWHWPLLERKARTEMPLVPIGWWIPTPSSAPASPGCFSSSVKALWGVRQNTHFTIDFYSIHSTVDLITIIKSRYRDVEGYEKPCSLNRVWRHTGNVLILFQNGAWRICLWMFAKCDLFKMQQKQDRGLCLVLVKYINVTVISQYLAFVTLTRTQSQRSGVSVHKDIRATQSTNPIWPGSCHQESHEYFLTVNLTVEAF